MNNRVILALILLAVYVPFSIAAFAVMGEDKRRAKKGLRRVRERTLFLWSALFGAVGGTLGMAAFRHKTKHWYFRLFFPLMAILQLALAVFLLVRCG